MHDFAKRLIMNSMVRVSCFYISTYEIDKDHWTDGFIKTDEALLT